MRCKFPFNENFVAFAKKHAGGHGNLIINFAWPNSKSLLQSVNFDSKRSIKLKSLIIKVVVCYLLSCVLQLRVELYDQPGTVMRLGLLDVAVWRCVETYTIDCMLFWALNCLQLGLIHRYAILFPTKPPQGIEYEFPMPPVISKCLSSHLHINFSLIQLCVA